MNNTSLDASFSGLTKNEPTEKQETPPQPEPPVIKKSVEQGTAREKQKEKERAKSEERFCTIVSSELLKKIRENAYAYFHGHTVGGTNPSLIEALGSTDMNLLVDVGFNKEVAKDCALYWNKKTGNLAKLINKVDHMQLEEIKKFGEKAKKRVAKEYTWEKICNEYEKVFTDWEN